jgi:excisionase family DNA binding protein
VKQLKDEFEYKRLVELLREVGPESLDKLAGHLEHEGDMEDRTLFSVTQLAKLSGIPATTVRRWCANGTIKAKRIGLRKWYITKEEIDRVLSQPREDDAPSDPGDS